MTADDIRERISKEFCSKLNLPTNCPKCGKKTVDGRILPESFLLFCSNCPHEVEVGQGKLGSNTLLRHILKEYLGDLLMDFDELLERIIALPGSIRANSREEVVTFLYNPEDPEIMRLLASRCEAFNKRGIRIESGKVLRMAVESPAAYQKRINQT